MKHHYPGDSNLYSRAAEAVEPNRVDTVTHQVKLHSSNTLKRYMPGQSMMKMNDDEDVIEAKPISA